MTFEQAKYKYNCYARDILGLVGELEIPSRDKSTIINMVINLKDDSVYVLRDQDGRSIATIDINTGKVFA